MDQSAGVERFVEKYAPDSDVRVPDAAFLDYAEEHVPGELAYLWGAYGLGFYGQQRVAVVDPGRWMGALREWLGNATGTIPFMVTSFGHIYHCDRNGVVQCLDPHFQSNDVVASSLEEFFGTHVIGDDSHIADLEGPREGARQRFGDLRDGECYYFNPPIALGGHVRPANLAKGDGVDFVTGVHQALVERSGR